MEGRVLGWRAGGEESAEEVDAEGGEAAGARMVERGEGLERSEERFAKRPVAPDPFVQEGQALRRPLAVAGGDQDPAKAGEECWGQGRREGALGGKEFSAEAGGEAGPGLALHGGARRESPLQ